MSVKLHLEYLDQMEQEELGARLENEDYFYLLSNYPDVINLIKKSMNEEQSRLLDESITFLHEVQEELFNQLDI